MAYLPLNSVRNITNPLDKQGGLAFDGVTASSGVVATLNASSVTFDTTVSVRFLVPESNPSVNGGLFCLTPSATTYSSISSYFGYIGTDGRLYIQRNSAVSVGQNIYDYVANFVTLYGGKVVDVTVVNNVTTPSLIVYINGVATATTSVSTGASVPTWAIPFTPTYCFIGKMSASDLFNKPIFSATLFNRALSASEVITLANQGVQEADKWGSLTAIVGPSTLNGGFETAGGGGADVFANWSEVITGATVLTQESDARPGSTGTKSMKIVRTNSADGTTVQQSVSLVAGKRYRVTFWGKTASSGRVNIVTVYSSTMDQVLTTSWAQYQGAVFTATATATVNFQIYMTSGTTGDYYIDDIEFNQVGSILDADLSAGVGYQVPDRSSNNYRGLISTSGTTWTLPRKTGQAIYTIAASGYLGDGTSRAIIPDNARIDNIQAYSTSGSTFSIGDDSGSPTNVIGSTTVSAATLTDLGTPARRFLTTGTDGRLYVTFSAANSTVFTINYSLAPTS